METFPPKGFERLLKVLKHGDRGLFFCPKERPKGRAQRIAMCRQIEPGDTWEELRERWGMTKSQMENWNHVTRRQCVGLTKSSPMKPYQVAIEYLKATKANNIR